MKSNGGEDRDSFFRSHGFTLALLGIALLAAIPRWVVAVGRYIEYDGYWNIWIAQQDQWYNFIREYEAGSHPPLYFLLLRALLWFGHTPLVYRSLSLIPGVVAVYVLGRTAAKAMISPVWAALAALAYGLAIPSIEMSHDVRSYMLGTCLVQISFYYFLDLIQSDIVRSYQEPPASAKPRILFAVTASLACLTEYYSVFYVATAFLVAAALPLFRAERRGAAQRLRAVGREIATFVLIVAPAVGEYMTHYGGREKVNGLAAFYYLPHGEELPGDFLFRNFRNELNLFLPWHVRYGLPYFAWMAALLAGAGLIFFTIRRWREGKNPAALVSVAMPIIILCALMAGGLAEAYPFGGLMRQQFILFPFAVVCPFLLMDRLMRGVPRPASLAAAGVLAIALTAVSVEKFRKYPVTARNLFTDQMEMFNGRFPSPAAIYVDRYTLMAFFIHHHDWKWEFAGLEPSNQAFAIYKISSGSHRTLVVSDWGHWVVDLHERDFYRTIAGTMRARQLPSIDIFSIAQVRGAMTETQENGYRKKVSSLSAAQGLCVQALDTHGFDVNAEFRPAGNCTGQ